MLPFKLQLSTQRRAAGWACSQQTTTTRKTTKGTELWSSSAAFNYLSLHSASAPILYTHSSPYYRVGSDVCCKLHPSFCIFFIFCFAADRLNLTYNNSARPLTGPCLKLVGLDAAQCHGSACLFTTKHATVASTEEQCPPFLCQFALNRNGTCQHRVLAATVTLPFVCRPKQIENQFEFH